MSNGSTSIGKNTESLLVSAQFGAYSKVVINVTADLFYQAGNDTGRTLFIDCPWGTQAMANNLLAALEGYKYQPYEALNAILDPAAELGDGVTVNGVYGGIFKLTLRSGVLHTADVSAPQDEEIDHEYQYTPASERKIERRLNNMQSELSIQAGEIAAKVDEEGGSASNVSWVLNSQNFKVKANGTDVLTVDRNGLTVQGDGNFSGNVQAKNIQYGGNAGTMSGNGITSRSIGTGRLTTGINTSLANGDKAIDAMFNNAQIQYTNTQWLTVRASYMTLNGSSASWRKETLMKPGGTQATIYWLGQGGQAGKP